VSTNLQIGLLLVIIGGIMEGTYAVSMRYTSRWKWEHIWGAGSLASLVLIAWPVAFATVPNLGAVFAEAGTKSLIAPTILGLGWGAGSIFFGLGVNAVGIAVGVSLVMGLIAIVGSLLPLLMYHPEQLSTSAGQILIAALMVMLVGIILCGIAGHLRLKFSQPQAVSVAAASAGAAGTATQAQSRKAATNPFFIGLVFCFLSGVLSPMVNFALIKGDVLRSIAIHHGASPLWAINAVWFLVFTVAYGLNVAYCTYLIIRNKNAAALREPGTGKYWLLASIMGFLWAGGIVLYGVGAAKMGSFGAYAGWPVLLISAIGASNVSGMIMGEWRGTHPKAMAVMSVALLVLVVAAVMLGFANRMMAA
jgi:L-rhamnose-H+ transport protein